MDGGGDKLASSLIVRPFGSHNFVSEPIYLYLAQHFKIGSFVKFNATYGLR